MRLRSEQPICQTSKTPVCLTYLVSSTSSCQWWSPRATPTRNPSTTTVSEHVQMPKEDDFSLGGRYIWTNLELFMKVILSSTLVKLITDAGQLSHKCFFSLLFPVVFLILLFVQFGVTTWLVLYPGAVFSRLLQLYNISDMNFKLLLVSLAALNFLICFVVEVSDLYGASQIPRLLNYTAKSTKSDIFKVAVIESS